MMTRVVRLGLVVLVIGGGAGLQPALAHAQPALRLATTTSTENSGLLRFLLPQFEARAGLKVQVIAVGTGRALELGKNGDVDVVLVHARAAEDRFVAEGHGVDRREVMFNDFIVAGPAGDPARVAGMRDVIAAFAKLAASGAQFVSRGDHSGTDQMEQAYWKEAGVKPATGRQRVAGVGMGEALTMAAELQAYLLTDRATYASYRARKDWAGNGGARTGLTVVVEGDPKMFNPYGVIAVSPKKYPRINHAGARRLMDWLVSAEGQALIARYRIGGQQVFFPAARPTGASAPARR